MWLKWLNRGSKVKAFASNSNSVLEIEFVDADGNPMANLEYILYLSDGSIRRGKTSENGLLREENIPSGDVTIELADGRSIIPG